MLANRVSVTLGDWRVKKAVFVLCDLRKDICFFLKRFRLRLFLTLFYGGRCSLSQPSHCILNPISNSKRFFPHRFFPKMLQNGMSFEVLETTYYRFVLFWAKVTESFFCVSFEFARNWFSNMLRKFWLQLSFRTFFLQI